MNDYPHWPLDTPDHLADALREHEATPEDLADLVPALLHLTAWQAPLPSAADTERLLARLTPFLPSPSLVRQVIRTQRMSQRGRLVTLLKVARIQVTIFHPAFWLVSAGIMLAGTTAILIGLPLDQSLLLRVVGPFLAYLGAVTGFRGASLRVLEFELACPPSPFQLTLARLVVVLGYDGALGLLLSLALWTHGPASFLILTLSWLMPLLLVAGLALLLSLRLPVQTASAISYGGWLTLLIIDTTSKLQALPLTPQTEALLGGIGLALLAVALLRLRASVHRLLPR